MFRLWSRLQMAAKYRHVLAFRRKGVVFKSRPVFNGGRPNVFGDGKLILGDRVRFRTTDRRARIGVHGKGTIEIGDRTFINNAVAISSDLSIRIGHDCKIADQVVIYDSNFHEVDEGKPVVQRPVVIGNNVWIGRCAIILPGTTIGDHTVIGAGAVVRGNIPAGVLVSGNPGTVVREIACSDGWVRK